ncbi:hypothetical protein AHAS_Ahas09G0098800 [Arachis hypogaea]
MKIDNNTSQCVDKSINENQSGQVETLHSNSVVDGIVASLKDLHIKITDLERLYNSMKGEMAILQVTVLDLGDRPAAPDQMPQRHYLADGSKGRKYLRKTMQT